MSHTDLQSHLYQARVWVNSAVAELTALRAVYEGDRLLPPLVRSARLLMVDSKIAALRAVVLNPEAHPWASDWNTETPA